jgi:hypothetical protein
VHVQNLATYYATCQGANTIQTYINTASDSIGTLGTGLQSASSNSNSPCYNDPYVIAMQVARAGFHAPPDSTRL